MIRIGSKDPPKITRQIRAEAAMWVAQLHAPTRNAETDSAMQRWLAESPAHAAALERAARAWDKTGNLQGGLPARGGEDAFHNRSNLGWMLAAIARYCRGRRLSAMIFKCPRG
jgi:ferric-dicitrate binding protein FerR (iron transport regulator)